jgi:hypothetical protein
MKIQALKAVVSAAVISLAGCSTNQLGVTPNIQFTPAQGQLFATVGTANIDGQAGLNVVATFRSPNGLTAVPISNATISGPAGFAGLAGSNDPGAGATTIPIGSAQNSFSLQSCLLGCNTHLAGIDMYGVGPPGNSANNSAPNTYPAQPQFGDNGTDPAVDACAPRGAPPAPPGGEIPFYGGPPAYPNGGQNLGFPEGFYMMDLGVAPPTGAYNVTLTYSQNGNTTNVPATANLASGALLPVIGAPTYVSDGAGGGSGTVTVPAGVTEVLVNILDAGSAGGAPACFPAAGYFTVLIKGAGAQNFTLPAGSIAAGENVVVQAIGFDYNAFELGPPTNLQQNPGLPAQADLTISGENVVTE